MPQLQQSFQFRTHGGKRRGAGRPRKGKRSSHPHKQRPEINPRHPLHITTRVVEDLPSSLRKKDLFLAIREATITVFERDGFRIVHASIQYNHLHVLAEAETQEKLSAGMQSFLISAAKQINAALGRRTGIRRRGKVFADRYHARPLTSPRAVRHALAYVLNNWRRHGEDRASFAADWRVDPFSSGIAFPGWTELADSPVFYKPPPTYWGLLTWFPQTWLLRVGWQRHGPVSVLEVPGRP